jgi:hypothetical protein
VTGLQAAQALGNLPQGLRGELIGEYAKIVRNYRERRWEAAELDGGRFSEIVYTILRGYVDGSYPATASKPSNFPQSCEALASANRSQFSQSVRLGIPRVLVGLYEIRNNRGVGHVGGDVDANHMDATYVLHAAQWVMAELVRLFHNTDVDTATKLVSALVARTLPMIWKVGESKRILDSTLNLADSTLLLLYGDSEPITDRTLARDLKQPRLSNYRRVLRRLDEQVLIEYNEATGEAFISPKGEKEVEERLLPGTASSW